VRRTLLVLTVALVMAVMMLAMAMPVFAQAADPCEGMTPASPPDAGAAPTGVPPESPPGYIVREPRVQPPQAKTPFTGCTA
jgi:hypothetical protein